MELVEAISLLLEGAGLTGLSKLKAETAASNLLSVLSSVSELSLDAQLIVRVPGDPNIWVVYGGWSDGSVDVIKWGGMFPRDTLVGWKRGQSIKDYNRGLMKEGEGEDEEPELPAPYRLPRPPILLPDLEPPSLVGSQPLGGT